MHDLPEAAPLCLDLMYVVWLWRDADFRWMHACRVVCAALAFMHAYQACILCMCAYHAYSACILTYNTHTCTRTQESATLEQSQAQTKTTGGGREVPPSPTGGGASVVWA